MTSFYNEHSRIYVSVDCIIFGFEEGQLKVLLGRRRMMPGMGEWSIYGGFVGEKEDVDAAADRVLLELTGIQNVYMRQVGAFGRVNRDPGERVVSIVYYALINVADYDKSRQTAFGLQWFDMAKLPKLYSDHNEMIDRALKRMRQKIKTEPVGFRLLPELFTLTQLQQLHEAVLGESLDKRNFRKRIKDMEYVEKTDMIDKKSSRRGAALYRFNNSNFKDDSTFKL